MEIEEIFKTLDAFFANNQIGQAETYLTACKKEAAETKDYAAYIAVSNELIGFYRSISKHQQAFAAAQDVLTLMEELQLDGTEHFATTLLNAATAYRAGGCLKEATKYYGRALHIYETLLSPEDYRFAGLYNNKSLLHLELGESQEALSCAKKALHIIKKLPDALPEWASTLTNMGLVYFQMQRAKEAKQCLQEALALFENGGKTSDAHYGAALAGVGEAYYRKGDYAAALGYYEKAAIETKKHFGENEHYALLCENCAVICKALQDAAKAAQYEEMADAARKRLFAGQV